MKIINDLKVWKKLLLGFGIIALLIFLMGILSIIKMSGIRMNSASLFEQDMPAIEIAGSIQKT